MKEIVQKALKILGARILVQDAAEKVLKCRVSKKLDLIKRYKRILKRWPQ